MTLEIPPQHKIDCELAAHLMDASAELARLNEQFNTLRWRVLRGEPEYFKSSVINIRSTVRKLAKFLDSIEYNIDHPIGEVKKD